MIKEPCSPRHTVRRPFAAGATALFLATLAACASSARFDGPGGARRLYEAKCGVCHVPWSKSEFPKGAWPEIVADFAPRAGLNKAHRARILEYLTGPQSAEVSGSREP